MPRTGKMIERAGTLDPYSGYTSVKGDPEFESRVKAIVGKPFESTVDPSVAQNILDQKSQYNILGINTHKAETPEQKKKVATKFGLASIPEGKHVFGIGAGASPTTWAHEFRHDKVNDETPNRIADLIYGSNSRDAYVANVDSLWENSYGLDTKTPFAEREKHALDLAHAFLNLNPEYRVDNINPDINRHAAINKNGSTSFSETVMHPIDAITGNTVNTEVGKIAKTTAQERAAYPFLLFAGREDLPRSKSYEGASLGEQVDTSKEDNDLKDALKAAAEALKTRNAKKRGGSIENTTHSRKII